MKAKPKTLREILQQESALNEIPVVTAEPDGDEIKTS